MSGMWVPELRCTFGGRSVVPDATVFTWDRIPLAIDSEVPDAFEFAPDWTMEILSPDQRATKVISNILHIIQLEQQDSPSTGLLRLGVGGMRVRRTRRTNL